MHDLIAPCCGKPWKDHGGIITICRGIEDLKSSLAAHRIFLGLLGQVLLPRNPKPTPNQLLRAAERLAKKKLHITPERCGRVVCRPHK